jgi:hypothetical protein
VATSGEVEAVILYKEDFEVAERARNSRDRRERNRIIAGYRERLTVVDTHDLFGDGEHAPSTLLEVVEAMRDEHDSDASENCPGEGGNCWVCHWVAVIERFAKAAIGSPLGDDYALRTPRELAEIIKDMNRPWQVRNAAADEMMYRLERAHG